MDELLDVGFFISCEYDGGRRCSVSFQRCQMNMMPYVRYSEPGHCARGRVGEITSVKASQLQRSCARADEGDAAKVRGPNNTLEDIEGC